MFTGTALTIVFISNRLGVKMPWAGKGLSREERFNTWLVELTWQSGKGPSEEVPSQVKTWIEQLSEKETKALLNKLAVYCKAVGIELEWLLTEQPLNEELRHATQDIVIFYLLSCMKGEKIKEDTQIFKAYQALDKNPKKNAAFGQQLYETLLAEGLIPPSKKGPLEISKRKDRKKIIEAIRQAASKKPVAFWELLKKVVQEMQSLREEQGTDAAGPTSYLVAARKWVKNGG